MFMKHTVKAALLFFLFTTFAFAKEDVQVQSAHVIRPQAPAEQIQNLKFSSRDFEVTSTQEGGEKKDFVILKGLYPTPGSTLSVNGKNIKLAEGGGFKLKLRIKGATTELQFAVQAEGKEQKEKISIVTAKEVFSEPQRVHYQQVFHFGVGLSFLSYADRNFSSYTEKALTLKLSANSNFSYSWSWGLNGYFTVLPFSKSGDITARYLGANARVGYLLSSKKSPWKFSVMLGAYYLTMFVSKPDLGFKNMMGPQLYPYLVRVFNNGDALSFYAKFSPVGGGFKILSLSNREIAAGTSYSFGFKNGHSLSLTADFAILQLTFPGQQNDLIKNNTITFGLAYGV